MECNINQRGKTVRMLVGVIVESAGWFILVLRIVGIVSGTWPWVAGGILLALGLVLILEGVFGWCVIRALGPGAPQ
ncbi:MAG: hypothetical protein O2800_00940 [Planctomycetota bacterium]|nr:hypothetical protein [Planctomycetota bacterium]